MGVETWASIGLVLLFILIGGVFAGTEIALVSLRESQIENLAHRGKRGERVAAVARVPNRFLAAVQIGVTVAGFFSAAYGASTIAPDIAPVFVGLGLSESAAGTLALVLMTLIIAYLSLVIGELVPKRLALQRSSAVALAVAPTLDRFAALMRPVIALLSASTNGVVRLLGGNPHQASEAMSEEELRQLVVAHQGLPDVEREILSDVFEAAERTLVEVMRPRHAVAFLDADQSLGEAVAAIADQPYSRYPVRDGSVDSILGFVHTRDLLLAAVGGGERVTVRDMVREIVVLPGTNTLLPSMTTMRRARIHIAVVIDEYGGTDGIVTLEDLVEELVGEIHDEHDTEEPGDPSTDAVADGPALVPGEYTIEAVADSTGIVLPDGPYETVGGLVMDYLDRVAEVGDAVTAVSGEDRWHLEVTQVDGNRIVEVLLERAEIETDAAVGEDSAE